MKEATMKKDVLSSVCDAAIEEECMWLITEMWNFLFKFSFTDQKLEIVAPFPEEAGTGQGLFSKIIKINHEIYLIPRMADTIYCYDLKQNIFRRLSIPLVNMKKDKKIDGIVQDEYLYCINRCPDAVIKISLSTKKVKVLYPDCSMDAKMEQNIYKMYKEPCLHEEKIIWTNYNNTLREFDLRTEAFCTKKLKGFPIENIERLTGVFTDTINDWIVGIKSFAYSLWLFTFEGRVFRYDKKLYEVNEKLLRYTHYPDSDGTYKYVIYDAAIVEYDIVFIPSYKNKCIKYCGDKRRYEEILPDYTLDWSENNRSYTICKPMNDGTIILYSYYEKCFYTLDIKRNSVLRWVIYMPFKELMEDNPFFKKSVIKEYIYCFDDIKYFIDNLSKSDDKRDEEGLRGKIGKKIFCRIK